MMVEDFEEDVITVFGYVYMNDTLPENTILVARQYVSCCMADASVIGYCVEVEDVNKTLMILKKANG